MKSSAGTLKDLPERTEHCSSPQLERALDTAAVESTSTSSAQETAQHTVQNNRPKVHGRNGPKLLLAYPAQDRSCGGSPRRASTCWRLCFGRQQTAAVPAQLHSGGLPAATHLHPAHPRPACPPRAPGTPTPPTRRDSDLSLSVSIGASERLLPHPRHRLPRQVSNTP